MRNIHYQSLLFLKVVEVKIKIYLIHIKIRIPSFYACISYLYEGTRSDLRKIGLAAALYQAIYEHIIGYQ